MENITKLINLLVWTGVWGPEAYGKCDDMIIKQYHKLGLALRHPLLLLTRDYV